MDIHDTPDLGRVIHAARVRRGWSEQQAATAAGISRRLVNQIEGGKHPNAEMWRVLALLRALDVRLRADISSTADISAQTHSVGAVTPTTADFDLDAHVARFSGDGR